MKTPLKQGARRSSGNASNAPVCTGPDPARPASSPCAASRPAAAGKKSGSNRPTGPERPDRHLTTARTQTTQARIGYRPVTDIPVPHPLLTAAVPSRH